MTLSSNMLMIVNVVVWVLCILIGIGIGALCGGWLGRFLGWMISNSLDENIIRGGQVGRRWGRILGLCAGAGLGALAALQATAYLAQMLVR